MFTDSDIVELSASVKMEKIAYQIASQVTFVVTHANE